MALDLNKEIKLFNKEKKIKLPVKKSMNLYQPDTRNDPKRFIAVGIIAFLVIVGLFANFVVFPKLNQINDLENQISDLNGTATVIRAKITNYDEVKVKYYRYSESYSNPGDELVDRITILTLINESSKDIARITSTNINGNSVSLKILTSDLEKVRELKNVLEHNTLVSDVKVYSASRSTGDVVSSISFNCVVPKEGE